MRNGSRLTGCSSGSCARCDERKILPRLTRRPWTVGCPPRSRKFFPAASRSRLKSTTIRGMSGALGLRSSSLSKAGKSVEASGNAQKSMPALFYSWPGKTWKGELLNAFARIVKGRLILKAARTSEGDLDPRNTRSLPAIRLPRCASRARARFSSARKLRPARAGSLRGSSGRSSPPSPTLRLRVPVPSLSFRRTDKCQRGTLRCRRR